MCKTTTWMAIGLLLLPAVARGQEPVKSFDQLNTRLKVGDKVIVTDTRGSVHTGKVLEITPSALSINEQGGATLPASDVSLVQERERDSLKNGALIGLGSGVALATTALVLVCAGEECDFEGDRASVALAVAVYGGIGAAIGTGIDALIPGRKRVVYRAPDKEIVSRMRVAPIITPRSKGIAVSFSF